MVTIIKKGIKKKDFDEKLSTIKNLKKFDAHKYCGILKLEDEPLQIQKKLRDEWE
ncbi:hypothetical protein BH23BAC1_BH23BAC1_21510 [soil metagenome]